MLTGRPTGKEQQVPCPNCFQLNHYNASRCQHCLGDTWRTERPSTYHEPSSFTMWFWITVGGILLTMVFGGVVGLLWFGFWLFLWLLDTIGFGRILAFGLVAFILAVLLL